MAPCLRLGQSRQLRKGAPEGAVRQLGREIKYRTVEEDVEDKPFKHIIAEIHASKMRSSRKSKPPTIQPTAQTRSSQRPESPGGEQITLGLSSVYEPTRNFTFSVKCKRFGISVSLLPIMKGRAFAKTGAYLRTNQWLGWVRPSQV